MLRRRVVVIGGDAAGMSAAAQAQREGERRGTPLDVVVVERGGITSYSACGIPYWVGGEVADAGDLVARTPEQHRANGLDVRTLTEATAIDLDRRRVLVRDLRTGAESALGFDELVHATGSVPVRPDVPGVDAPGVHRAQTIPDGAALRAHLAGVGGRPVRRVVVVGSGYIGLEVAEACRARGLEVAVVGRSALPLSGLDPEVGGAVADALRAGGVELLSGDEVVSVDVDAHGRARGVTTASGRELPADAVVLGAGVRPHTALAEAAGIPLGESGGVAVDASLRTGVDGVWAAGDCVESRHLVSGRPVVVALGTHAVKQGRVVGTNLAGGRAAFPGVLGTAITRVVAVEVARTGLSSEQARAAGFSVVTTTTGSTTRAGYFPGAQPITVTVVAERGTGRLLGAQVVGGEGSGKRIDVLAACTWHAMDVADVALLDLSYAPPFSPTLDPVVIACRRAAEAVAAAGSDTSGGSEAVAAPARG